MRYSWLGCIFLLLIVGPIKAQQNPDLVVDPNIHTALIHPVGSPLAPPIIILNSGGALQISFDDFKASYQDYAYSIELVDSNWHSIDMNDFEYINGFNFNPFGWVFSGFAIFD